jgi:hypothetical protein
VIRITRVPEAGARLLAPLKSYFSSRPYWVFCWLPKGAKGYQSEHALFRQRLPEGVLPAWCRRVSVGAEAAYASRATLPAIQARPWSFTIAFPRSWELANGQHLRDLVPHLPIHCYRKVRVPLRAPTARRRLFWAFAKRAKLRPGGEVTVVLSRRRRHDGPRPTKLLVTTRPHATAHVAVAVYLRRWPAELFCKEWQGVVGVGQPQVTKDATRVERSVAVALRAYWLLVRLRAKQIKPGSAWSAFTLKQRFAWEIGARQLKREARREAYKEVKLQLAA